MRNVTVLVADDEALVRRAVRHVLDAEDGIEVVGEASDGGEAVEAALRLRPAVVVMDVRMGGLDGVAATRRLLATAGPGAPRVLVLTADDDDRVLFESLRAGASGFLLKDACPQRLAEAVRRVARGEAALAPGVTRRLIGHFVSQPQAHRARSEVLGELTGRELELLEMLARGLSNAELAARLYVSEATVKTHLTSLFGKLGLRSRTQAVVLAYESGLVQPGDAELIRRSEADPTEDGRAGRPLCGAFG